MTESISKKRRAAWLAAAAVGALVGWLPLSHAGAEPTARRIDGSDRYTTSANISKDTFAANVPVAYIATGTGFADALAGAPAAAINGGPILLAPPDSLTVPVSNELNRLKPAKIVILGGTAAVSTTIQSQLAQFVGNDPAKVTRLAGNDRYGTAAAISAATFAGAAKRVYVTTGENFPDALSSGPAVISEGPGPVLLTQKGALPQSTAAELARLKTQGTIGKIVVVGGVDAVSDSVKSALGTYSSDVGRVAGPDRYSTSVLLSQAAFPSSTSKVYLATGANYPDALARGAAAAFVKGPVLLVQGTCIPSVVNDEITRLNPGELIVLGGTTAVSDAVLNRFVCGSTTSTQPGSQPSVTTPDTNAVCQYANQFGLPCPSVPSS